MLANELRPQALLAELPVFAGLGAQEVERIAAHARPIRVDRGAVLVNVGETPRGFYLVVFGQIKLAFSSPRGDEKVIDILGAGQSFGEAMIFVPRPYPVTAQAMTESLVLFIGSEPVLEEIDRDARLAARMIAGLCRRIHGLMADLEAVSMHSGMQRVIGYLLRDCRDDLDNPCFEVRLPTTKGVIASRLNITQEHFSRILSELSLQGLIEVQGRTIRVPDVERLRHYAPGTGGGASSRMRTSSDPSPMRRVVKQ